ncbi:nitrate reductase molybdenum cofactor assembly chaperone [Embleya hyalina]|uniref:Nitrate reductase molybdenum cofactor assembly chaperone n=1 Tax=Embleya hyalina TaxID=516124 RepID=A0A401YLZ4_9ACTN|nr:nitrate reductase molybdenum cofactor assembly chaperone [Embleya hyalina]GCD95634.1 nitrate reductase molybdenum cofactor assembly chaperone [Embleya hyalina]
MKAFTDRFRPRAGRTRHRHTTAVLRQAAALCLHYPDRDFHARVPLLRAALAEIAPSPAAVPLTDFLDEVCAWPADRLAAHYVTVFDLRNRRSLYLSWWREGDTRRRGTALVGFKRLYRAHGLDFVGTELPDFLPAVLEFAAVGGPEAAEAGTALLCEHRPGIELLRFALHDARTPYARVLEAVCATLPGPSPRDRAEARALAHAGPPREDVGLAAFGDAPAIAHPGAGR